jgi:hypothetical protein
VYAEGNVGGSGTAVYNGEGVGDVLLKGINTFLGNHSYGLMVFTKGSVTAQYLIAYENSFSGVQIDNSAAPSTKGVTISGGGEFLGNESGLVVSSQGSVSLNRVIASNTSYGIYVRANGNATLTCSHTSGNNTGLFVAALDGTSPISKLVLQGLLSYGNTTNETITASTIVRTTTCP